MILHAALTALAELATTGGTFDSTPWIVGGLIAVALGAFALVAVNRRRAKADRELGAADRDRAGRSDAEITAAQEGDLDGDGFADDSRADRDRDR